MAVAYDTAGTRPTGGPSKGTTALRDLICDEFEWCPRLSFYNPRDICFNQVAPDGSGRICNLSPHAEGRAFDAMTTRRDQGDPLADWCVANHEALQIQEVIWFGRIWTSKRLKWKDFTGTNPHKDHVHVSQNFHGAAHPELVDAFRGLLVREPQRVQPRRGVGRNPIVDIPGNQEGGEPHTSPLALLAKGIADAGQFIAEHHFVVGMGNVGASQAERDAFIWIRHFVNVKLDLDGTEDELVETFYGPKSKKAVETFQRNIANLIAPTPFDVSGRCGPATWFWLTLPAA